MTEYKNQSLERGFQILEFLDSSPSGRAVSEVARATGLHRATAHRLLEVLCSLGYAYKAEDRRYWIGYAMHVFGHPASVMSRMKHHAHPFLMKLAHEVDETANLAFLEGIQAFIVDRVSTESAHRSDVQIGGYFDAHATSMGKALLSMRSNHEVQASYKATRLNAYYRDHHHRYQWPLAGARGNPQAWLCREQRGAVTRHSVSCRTAGEPTWSGQLRDRRHGAARAPQ